MDRVIWHTPSTFGSPPGRVVCPFPLPCGHGTANALAPRSSDHVRADGGLLLPGYEAGQQGWIALTWFALSIAVFCLAAWADERWPGSRTAPPDVGEGS